MPKILYLVANDTYFLSHRLPIAVAAQKENHDVVVVAKDTGKRKDIEKYGMKFIPLTKLERGGINPFKDFAALIEIKNIYYQEKPDIVHHVAMKPVLYGSIAAWLSGVPKAINALTGLGYLFISDSLKAKVIRAGVMAFFKGLFSKKPFCLLVQNRDDLAFFKEKIPKAKIEMIKGSGVDVNAFRPGTRKKEAKIRIAFVARMLWDKGVQEAIDAMKVLKNKGVKADLYLYGDPDPENPKSISESQLKRWQQEGLCHWKGHTHNISKIYQESDIAVLPSYREGLPKSLIEAAACGLPIVTTNVPGCREVVEDEVNGFLVPLKDHTILAERIEELVNSKALRDEMGRLSRQKAEKEFAVSVVVKETLELYRTVA